MIEIIFVAVMSYLAGRVDAIRVFAVIVNEHGKVLRGLTKSRRVYRTKNWRDNVKQAYIDTLELVKQRL